MTTVSFHGFAPPRFIVGLSQFQYGAFWFSRSQFRHGSFFAIVEICNGACEKIFPGSIRVLSSRIARFALLSAIGSLTGVLVASVDIEFPFNRSRWQWFVALWILLPVVSLMAVFTRRRIRWHRALLWMSLELAGCLCFFQATIERIWTHYNVNVYDVPDLLELVFMTGVACFHRRSDFAPVPSSEARTPETRSILPRMRILPDRIAPTNLFRMRPALHA